MCIIVIWCDMFRLRLLLFVLFMKGLKMCLLSLGGRLGLELWIVKVSYFGVLVSV